MIAVVGGTVWLHGDYLEHCADEKSLSEGRVVRACVHACVFTAIVPSERIHVHTFKIMRRKQEEPIMTIEGVRREIKKRGKEDFHSVVVRSGTIRTGTCGWFCCAMRVVSFLTVFIVCFVSGCHHHG